MKIVSTIHDFRKWRKDIMGSIGFIPTMGAFHDGHLSLVEQSNKMCNNTVVSIYLNPTQFGPNEDFDTYPQTTDSDIKQLSQYQVDCIFLPSDSEIYPYGFSTKILESTLSHVLEGKSRPGFFSGIMCVVSKLFNIIEPSHTFFGEKDAQQLRIIQKMIIDLNYPIEIISCPIIRERNGLAMSSRNSYLTPEERKKASIIFQALKIGENLMNSGEKKSQVIRDKITEKISSEASLSIDYVSVADSLTLVEISGLIERDVLVSVAVYLEKVRLIDNFYFSTSFS